MDWLTALVRLRDRREAAVVATVSAARGHAPREAGAKLVVASRETWGSIGGGNVEATVIDRARTLLADGAVGAEIMTFALSDRAETRHGVQCCGGEVTVLLEPMRPRPTIAVFGLGHVGFEIAHVLARHPVELVLVDSRPEQLDDERLAPLRAGVAAVEVRHAPAPETVVAELPVDATMLVLTHDHAEDLVLCDAALRADRTGYTGLIGSTAKWTRFVGQLADLGHERSAIDRITCPIGMAGIDSKDPAAIAVAVVADLLHRSTTARPGSVLP